MKQRTQTKVFSALDEFSESQSTPLSSEGQQWRRGSLCSLQQPRTASAAQMGSRLPNTLLKRASVTWVTCANMFEALIWVFKPPTSYLGKGLGPHDPLEAAVWVMTGRV